MRAESSLSEQQRAAAVALFETGAGERAVATELGTSRILPRPRFDQLRRGQTELAGEVNLRLAIGGQAVA